MATGQQIVYDIMKDLPLDPIKGRVALWKRLFRKSKGLGQHDIIDEDEFNLWLEAAKASKTAFPWARDLASLLEKQMGAAAWGRLDTELRKMAEGMTGADLLGFDLRSEAVILKEILGAVLGLSEQWTLPNVRET